MFGQNKPVFGTPAATGFGFVSTPFGASTSTNQPSTSIFGQPSTSTQQASMFGGSVFGSTIAPIQGTTVKFNPQIVTDTVQKNGQKVQVNAKHMCISAMKEYGDKSIEELRVDDYIQNRKSGSSAGTKSIFSNTNTTPFGFGAAQTTASSLFGSTSTAQPAQSSIFGNTSNPASSIFGSTQPIAPFGQTTQNSIFGTKPLFGNPTSATAPLNLSGTQQSQAGFGFGQNTQNSIFGSNQAIATPSATSTFSLFGSQPAFGKPAGTSIFGPTTATTSSLFRSTVPAVQASPFGAPVASQTSSIFGGVKPAGTSIFGSPSTATTSSSFGSGFGTGFGTKTTATGLFGVTPTASNAGFGIGTATSTMQSGLGTSLFSAKKPSPFGAPASAATPAFGFGSSGSATVAGTNLFGNATGFGLGVASQPAQPSGSIFAAPNAVSTGGFFNKPAVNNFGFGQPTSLFGAAPTASTETAVGNFIGGSGLGNTSLLGFGNTAGNTMTSFGSIAPTNQTVLAPLVQQLTQNARAQQYVLDMVRSMPYGQSTLFRHLTAQSASTTTMPTTSSVSTLPANSTVKASGVSVLSASAAANTIVELHRTNSLSFGRSPGRVGNGLVTRRPMQPTPINRKQLFTGFREDDALLSAQSPISGDHKNGMADGCQNRSGSSENRFFVRREAWKRLDIPRCVRTSIIERSLMSASDLENQVDETQESESCSNLQQPSASSKGSGDANASTPKVQFRDAPMSPISRKTTNNESPEPEKKQLPFTASSSPQISDNIGEQTDAANWTLPPDVTFNQTALGAPGSETFTEGNDSHPTSTANRAGIRLSKPGYYMFPTFEELDNLIDDNGHCVVQDLVIGRQSYGHILFPGLTDITGIDFDEVVHIRRREVVIYPDDTTKPPQGYGLNRKAEITLDGVWPTDKFTREFIKSPQRLVAIRFDERLEKATHKMDASFIEYRPDTGSWVFEVKHFSKYRLEDSDDETEVVGHSSNAATNNHSAVKINGPQLQMGPTKAPDSRHLVASAKNETWEWEMPTSPLLLQPTQAFRGVRDSLFVTANRLGEDELEVQIEDGDSDFLFRRSRLGQADRTLLGQYETSASPELHDISQKKQLAASHTDELDDAADFLSKLEPLQSIYNPVADLLPTSQTEKRWPCSIPYERIAKLIGTHLSAKDVQSCFTDAGLCKGDLTRLSWSLLRGKGKPSKFVLLSADPSTDTAASVVVSSIPTFIDPHEEVLLNSTLQTSTRTPFEADSSSCPHFYPEAGPSTLNAYLACLDGAALKGKLSTRMRTLRRALLLCQALWGHYDTSLNANGSGDTDDALGLEDYFVSRLRHSNLEEENPHLTRSFSAHPAMNDLARKQAVSEWIRWQLHPWLESKLEELGLTKLLKAEDSSQSPWNLGEKISKSAVFAGIFACLCCGEPAAGCRLALTCRMSHLASCLSMAAISDPLCKQDLQKQLRVWNALKVLPFMPQQILRIYALLAGEIKIPISGAKGKTVLNVLSGVPYLQALGVHLWYLVDHSTDLAKALKLFSSNWHACDTFEIAPPHPPKDGDLSTRDISPTAMLSRSASRDVCYHLLRLALRPWHSLERTLDPQSILCSEERQADAKVVSTSNNWPSSWHLWRVLVSIGLTSLNVIATSRLHIELATHLEAGGLWEWAVFVLMHEAEPRVRAASVKKLLARHVTLKHPLRTSEGQWRVDEESISRFNQAEVFIVDRFGVPVKWLHEAKACLARSLLASQSAATDADTHRMLASLETAHWLAAGHLEAAHDICTKHLLPEIILHFDAASIVSTLTDADITLAGSSSLASQLLTVLQPFSNIPQESHPASFDYGAGVYLAYARVLHLVHQFSLRNNDEDEDMDMEKDAYIKVRSVLPASEIQQVRDDLNANTQQLIVLLQSMPTPTIRDRVIKSEMATVALRLIFAFLHNYSSLQTSDSSHCQPTDGSAMDVSTSADSPALGKSLFLCQQLNMIANIDLPSEARLNSLEALTALSIAKCIF